MIDRDKMVLDRCAGKKVLHVGCCAAPGCRMMAESGRLLHLKLRGVASQLWGLDMSSEDITYLEEEHRFENLVVGDAQKIDQSFPSETAFDVIVAGELIEHLNNPGQFLDGAHSLLAPEGSLIVSSPTVWLSLEVSNHCSARKLFTRTTIFTFRERPSPTCSSHAAMKWSRFTDTE